MLFQRLISLFLLLILLISCSLSKSVQTVPVTVNGAIFGGDASDSIALDLQFDTKWITKENNKVYNSRLASFAALLCDDVYFRSKDVAKGTANRVIINGNENEYTQTSLLEKLGYTDVRYIESFKQKIYSSDSNDSVTMLMAYKNVDDKYDSFVFVLRGCFSAGERLSAFDIGCDNEAYYALTGDHPEWTNKSVLKGLDIAANRAMEFIGDYISEHDSADRKNTAFTTGHSRGASLADIIGAEFEDDRSMKSYTYTFNTMAFTADKNAKSYKTIFNIFDSNDYYSDPLPFGEEKLYHNGTDISVKITDNDKLKSDIASLKGRDDYISMSDASKAEYDKLFSEAFPNRASLYEMKTRTEEFDSAEIFNSRFEELTKNISDLGLNGFVTVTADTDDNTISVCYCGAALLYSLAQIQCYGEAAYNVVISLFGGDEAYCRLAEITQNELAVITGGHLLVNSYIIARDSKIFY